MNRCMHMNQHALATVVGMLCYRNVWLIIRLNLATPLIMPRIYCNYTTAHINI